MSARVQKTEKELIVGVLQASNPAPSGNTQMRNHCTLLGRVTFGRHEHGMSL